MEGDSRSPPNPGRRDSPTNPRGEKMIERIGHNCGLCVVHTLHDAHRFIRSLQHRGREAAGMAAVGEGRIDIIKWEGGVEKFDVTDLHKIFPSPHYHTYMAHVRYATLGRKDHILEDAHPHVIGGRVEHRGNHILIWDCDMAAVHNGQVNREYFSRIPAEQLHSDCDTEALLHHYRQHGEHDFLRQIPGAYTMAIADKGKRDVIVLRDRSGIKPGVLGWKDGKYGVASEDIAFRKNGGRIYRGSGAGLGLLPVTRRRFHQERPGRSGPCPLFLSVELFRRRGLHNQPGERAADKGEPGRRHGRRIPPAGRRPGDLSPPLSGGGRQGLRQESRPPLSAGVLQDARGALLSRNHGHQPRAIHRREPAPPAGNGRQAARQDRHRAGRQHRSGKQLAAGRGTCSTERSGSRKAYLASYTPPIGIVGEDNVPRGCMFGVDMPPEPPAGDEFLARGRNVEEISEIMGMPVVYLSPEGMLRAFARAGVFAENTCTYCIGGRHPFAGATPGNSQLDLLGEVGSGVPA